MLDRLDAWRVARQLLRRYGADAEARAERNRRYCEWRGFEDGVAFWVEVVAAIAQLRATGKERAHRH